MEQKLVTKRLLIFINVINQNRNCRRSCHAIKRETTGSSVVWEIQDASFAGALRDSKINVRRVYCAYLDHTQAVQSLKISSLIGSSLHRLGSSRLRKLLQIVISHGSLLRSRSRPTQTERQKQESTRARYVTSARTEEICLMPYSTCLPQATTQATHFAWRRFTYGDVFPALQFWEYVMKTLSSKPIKGNLERRTRDWLHSLSLTFWCSCILSQSTMFRLTFPTALTQPPTSYPRRQCGQWSKWSTKDEDRTWGTSQERTESMWISCLRERRLASFYFDIKNANQRSASGYFDKRNVHHDAMTFIVTIVANQTTLWILVLHIFIESQTMAPMMTKA